MHLDKQGNFYASGYTTRWVEGDEGGYWSDFRFVLTKFDRSGRQWWVYHYPSVWTHYCWAFFDELGHAYAMNPYRLAKFRLVVRSDGDVSGDGCVNDLDLARVLVGFGTSDVSLDVNGDGIVNEVDVRIVLENFGLGCEP